MEQFLRNRLGINEDNDNIHYLDRAYEIDAYEKQEELLGNTLKKIDIVICTALIPGKKAPLIIKENMFNDMQTETSGKFGGLGIEVGMEHGVVKVISPIDNSPASRVGIKAGDYIVKIGDDQVQGKSLMEAVKLMRGPVGTSIELTVRRKNVKKPLKFKIIRK